MTLDPFRSLKALFRSTGPTDTLAYDPGPSDYSPSEIASLRSEKRANSAAAVQMAGTRGYVRNRRAAALS